MTRDLTWSRHQLEELAERRFLAAQSSEVPRSNVPSPEELQFQVNALTEKTSFQDLFKKVAHADFSSYLAKLQVGRYKVQSSVCVRQSSRILADFERQIICKNLLRERLVGDRQQA